VLSDDQARVNRREARGLGLDAQQHYGENIGDTDTQAIFVELKDIRPTPATGGKNSPLGPRARDN
jgi:hypothetical protein